MHKLGSWLSCGNWTIFDEYDEKFRLCNPFKLTRGFAAQIKYCNSCLEEFYDPLYAPFVTMIELISGNIHIPV